MESRCKALSNKMALKYSTFHKKSLWWKLTSCQIEVTSEKMPICYLMQLKSFQSHEDFTNPWLWGGGSPSRGLPEGLPSLPLSQQQMVRLFCHVFVLPLTQLWLYCHWNSAYLGFHSNSVLPRPSSVSTWCMSLSWSIASVSLKDLLRKSLSGLSY